MKDFPQRLDGSIEATASSRLPRGKPWLSPDAFVVIGVLLLLGVSSLVFPFSPWAYDGWYQSSTRLFPPFDFSPANNYTPIAAPALQYFLIHQIALFSDLDLIGEFYLTGVLQHALLMASILLIYFTCRRLASRATSVAVIACLSIYLVEIGLAQHHWSENATLFLAAAVLHLIVKMYRQSVAHSQNPTISQVLLLSISLALLILTRMIPVLIIPAVALLFYRLVPVRELTKLVSSMVLITAALIALLMITNVERFGRFELTNSSGRHLWQGVMDFTDEALAGVSDYQRLKQANPQVQGMNHWEVYQLQRHLGPNEHDRVLKALAIQAIWNEPILFFRQGFGEFFTTIRKPSFRLGFTEVDNPKGPLKTDQPLPPLGRHLRVFSASSLSAADNLALSTHRLIRKVYPIVIFVIASTLMVFIFTNMRISLLELGTRGGARLKSTLLRHRKLLLPGLLILLAFVLNLKDVSSLDWPRLQICALLALVMSALTAASRTSAEDSIENIRRVGLGPLYLFMALIFFGCIWLGWQVEKGSARYSLTYLPFLGAMAAIAARFWVSELQRLHHAYRIRSREGRAESSSAPLF